VHRLTPFVALLLAAQLLAACVTQGPRPLPQGAFRAKDAPIYSSAVLEPARLVGRWKQVAGFGPPGACKPGGVEISRGAGGLRAVWRLCLGGQEARGSAPMQPAGPGRFDVAGQAWWVLWADGDYRTLAIGTPDGGFGFVLDRSGGISGDRLRAAREILAWNGYDLNRFTSY